MDLKCFHGALPSSWTLRFLLVFTVTLWAITLGASGQDGNQAIKLEGDGSDDGVPTPQPPRAAFMTIGPVEGFTTAAHRATDPVVLPLFSRVPFTVGGVTSGHTVKWEGLQPVHVEGARADFEFKTPGTLTLTAVVNPGGVRLPCNIRVKRVTPRGLPFTFDIHPDQPFKTSENSNNIQTVDAYFSLPSIASVSAIANGLLATSVGQTLVLTAQPKGKLESDGLASLLEWRVDGRALGLGKVPLNTGERPGRHTIAVGPPSAAKSFDLEIYSVSIGSDYPEGHIPQGRPVTFRARTEPAGLERLVTWLAATKFGSAEPTLGRGPIFTTTFDKTYAVEGSGPFQWLGVRADDARLGQDAKTPVEGVPRIDTPGLDRNAIPCSINASAPLPAGMNFVAPSAEATQLVATLPALEQATVDPQQVFNAIIAPFVAKLGTCFDRGTQALLTPPQVLMESAANTAGVIKGIEFDRANYPQLFGPLADQVIAALKSGISDPATDAAYEEGMGMTVAQALADIGRHRYVIPYQQVHTVTIPGPATGGTAAAGFAMADSPAAEVTPQQTVSQVPIEHTLLLAAGWVGQSVTTLQGTLIDTYTIANQVSIDAASSSGIAIQALRNVPGIDLVTSQTPDDTPVLVLLPYDSDANGIPRLRYSYRMILHVITVTAGEGPYLLWLDAQSGEILKLDPLFSDVDASGETYKRDPGVGTTIVPFQVDAASGGQYVLKLTGVMNRVDYQGNGYNALDVGISDTTNGSSATFANFDQFPINDETQALCASGSNKAFQQVNFFASLYRYRQTVLDVGIFEPFPVFPWRPRVDITGYCNANSAMAYGSCGGYFNALCPDYSTGTLAGENFMNFAHDNTVVAHELAHNITPRLACQRPIGWCCGAPSCTPPCSVPQCWAKFHDLADFWADHLENTNCTGGWVAKNLGGVNARLYCAVSDEGGFLPRQHLVTVPFNPAIPLDHFPEHRSASVTSCGVGLGYSDGQIPAAALWQVRVGMRSLFRPSGVVHFGIRYQRALEEAGFLGFTPNCRDLGIYQHLYNLEVQMVDQWATSGSPTGPQAFRHNGPHTTGKVLAGFAKAGLFLIPPACLDGGIPCSMGEIGADAVVDVDDNDTADDLTLYSVYHPEVDYLRIGGPPPTFHVWTGPRYRLDGPSGVRTLNSPSPCNAKITVEVSTDPFSTSPPTGTITVLSPLITVDTDPTTPVTPECYGTWSPSAADWTALQAGGNGTRLYYRARTRDAADANERLSTLPGNGLWTIPPSYAVLRTNGMSPY